MFNYIPITTHFLLINCHTTSALFHFWIFVHTLVLRYKKYNKLFKIEKDLPPVDVMFLYDVINKIGELSDRAEQVGHRISLIASR